MSARDIYAKVEVVSKLLGRMVVVSPHCKQGSARHGKGVCKPMLGRARRKNKKYSSFLHSVISRPSSEEGHDTCAEDDASCSIDNVSDRSFIHFLAEEELVCKELDETSVEQDAGAERVEDTACNCRSG